VARANLMAVGTRAGAVPWCGAEPAPPSAATVRRGSSAKAASPDAGLIVGEVSIQRSQRRGG